MTTLRTNEVRYAFDTRITDLATNTTLGTATRHNYAAITLTIPETSSRTFLSVRLRLTWRDRFTVANEATGVRVGIKLGAAATDDLDRTFTLANTGDHVFYNWERDVTDYFNANFGAGATQTAVASIAVATTAASNIGGSITACLIICYQYDDDVGTTRVKSIPIPIQSHHTTLTNVQQEIGTTGGTGNAPASQIPALDTYLKEATKTYKQAFLESTANDESAAVTDITPFIQIDATAEVARGLIGQALQTTQPWLDILIYDTATFATNATHAVKMRADVTARMCFAGSILWVTFTYDKSATTSITCVACVPITQAHDDSQGLSLAESQLFTLADAQILIAELNVPETTPALMQSAAMLNYNVTSTVVGSPTVAAGTQTGRLYTAVVSAGGEHPIIHRVDHNGGAGSQWSLARGKNRLTFSIFDGAANTRHNLQHAYALIVYSADAPAAGPTAGTRMASFIAGVIATATATTIDFPAASQRAANLGSVWSLSAALIEGRNCMPGTGRLQFSMAFKAGEFDAVGWLTMVQVAGNFGELLWNWFYFPFTRSCNRHWLDLGGKVLVTNTRRTLLNASFVGMLAHWYQVLTFHNLSYTVTGTVTVGGVNVGAGKSVEVFAKDSAGVTEHVTTTTTAAGGIFNCQVPDDYRTYFVTYVDGANLGRSVNGTAGVTSFDVTIPGGGAAETVPPTEAVTSPTPGLLPGAAGAFSASYLTAKDTPVIHNIQDASSNVAFVKLSVAFSDRPATEEVYAGTGAATGFVYPYDLYSSVSGNGSAGVGYTFSIRRNDGWPAGVVMTLKSRAVDSKGNVL